MAASCWRWPFQERSGGYGAGNTGSHASNKDSAPAGAFAVLGARADLTPRLFVEGRYATTLGDGGYRFYKSEIIGATTWWSVSVGFWLNPRLAPTAF